MREILFRGKRTDTGKWTYGYYVQANYSWHKHGRHRSWIVAIAYANGGWFAAQERHAVDPDSVEQYIGLTDKNGRRIFEGDIVMLKRIGCKPHVEITYGIVEHGVFNCGCCNGVYGWTFGEEDIGDYSVCEVIGNIHDNPELLDKERK